MEENNFYFGEESQDSTEVMEESSTFEDFGYGESNSDETEVQEEYQETDTDYLDEEEESVQSDYVDQLLRARGIDRNNIEITEEDGTVSTVTFDQLSDEDKLALLQDDSDNQPLITDSEIEFINYLRANRISSLKELAEGIAKQAIAHYQSSQVNEPAGLIDQLDDSEVIAYDLVQKFGDDITDEEVDAEVNRIMEDEEAFKKRASLLRTYYRNAEEAQRKLYEDEQAAAKQENTRMFLDAYVGAARELDTIQGIDLEDDDKKDLLDFVLTKDQFGRTEFSKVLDDPAQVLKMAWFIKNGEMAAQATRDYFAQQLSKQRAAAAKSTAPKTRAVSRPATNQKPAQKKQETNSFKF